MDKKTLPLVILLIVAIVFYGQILEFLGLVEPVPEPTAIQADSIQVAPDWAEAEQQVETEIERQPAERLVPTPVESIDSLGRDTIFVKTNKYEVVLSNYGGGPVSLKLLDFTYRDGQIIEMLPDAIEATPTATFAGGTFSTARLPFVSNLQPGHYDATRDTFEVVYTYDNGSGGQIQRTLRFYPDEYHYDLTLDLLGTRNLGFERQYRLAWNTPLGVTEPQPQSDYEVMEAVTMQAGSRETLDDFEDGKLRQTMDGQTSWVGLREKYFAAVLIPHREVSSVFANGEKFNVSTPEGSIEARRITAGMVMEFAGVDSLRDSVTVFVGPLDYTLLSEYNVGLEDMLDIGTTPFVGWIIKPFAIAIIWVLPRMYDYVPNYGMVIILFALLVKIITLPLSMKSFKSMQAMRDLQPKIEELKVKHKKNPQAVNKEMMKLYKKHGVNPISGCLPMLPQMPLFFALFSVFRSTILLRDAPFVWFINDLSRGASGLTDPYMILVVIMVVAQFLSQKLTMPSTAQNKMIGYIMPLFMGFIFYKFAAGLVLYWVCFSVFSLLDYVLFKRRKNTEVITT